MRVPNGRKVKLTCKNCGKESNWHECRIEDSIKVYAVVELWKNSKRVMQCGECLATCDYYEMFPGEKEEEEKQAAEKKQKELQHEQELEAKKKAEEEAERKRKEEIACKKREEEKKAKDAAIEDELEALKKSMGMD